MNPIQTENKPERNEDGTFAVGNPGGPGRPKGKTLKEFARDYLMSLPDAEKQEYLAKLPPEVVWKMAEGNPHQSSDTKIDLPSTLAELIKRYGATNKPGDTELPKEG